MTNDSNIGTKNAHGEQIEADGEPAENTSERLSQRSTDADDVERDLAAQEFFTVRLDGESIAVPTEMTTAELKQAQNLPEESVLTCRGEDGFVAINSGSVVAEEVAPGTELRSQPLAGSEVFGRR